MCFNKRVLVGLGVVALGIIAFAPKLFLGALPLLAVAACPLSMIFMMRGMNRGQCGTREGEQTAAEPQTRSTEAELRELRDEINILRAELRMRSRDPQA